MRKETPYINAHEQISHEIYLCIFNSHNIYMYKKKHHINAQKQILHVICLLKFNSYNMYVDEDDVVHFVLDYRFRFF
jgi:hypothetical protein